MRMIAPMVSCVLVGLCCLAELAPAAYKPMINASAMAEAKKGISALKMLSPTARQACIAERLGLLYMDASDSAYSGRPWTDDVGFHYYPVKHGSKYMGGNGKEYDFFTERAAARQKKFGGVSGNDIWNRAMLAMEMAGEDTVFSAFVNEVTKVVQQTARRHLRLLPKEMRDSMLAQIADLLYVDEGGDAYADEKSSERYGTINMERKCVWREPRPDAKFRDSTGKEWKHEELWSRKGISGKVPYSVDLIRWCVMLVGEDDILSLFPREVKDMRKYNASKQAPEAEPPSRSMPPA